MRGRVRWPRDLVCKPAIAPDPRFAVDASRSDPDPPRLKVPLLLEVAPGHGCVAHMPVFPGLCFRAGDPAAVPAVASRHVVLYARWLREHDARELSPDTAELVRRLRAGSLSDLEIVETERRIGSPVWLSGNPAVLFQHDRRALSDASVGAHISLIRLVLASTRRLVAPLSPTQSARTPAPGQRSINETLEHIGNCIWWYCSRIDDDLPEPEEPPGEQWLARMDRLLDAACAFLLGIRLRARTDVHVPKRFPTSDPAEEWTHAKVCRRQAEHVWEHLPGIRRAVEVARETGA